jgi:MoaA/NifB/PqqE/SkfB family radical SAM enzyme/pimeloyl-ACP methyl ester carboxylesterase
VSAGILLVHGYSGSPDSLAPLAASLERNVGQGSTRLLCLPGHGAGTVPRFDKALFIRSVLGAVQEIRNQGRALILLGHSTGGALLLAALAESGATPDLLVLASVPKKIDTAYLDRWNRHRSGMPDIDFTSVANMISFINAAGSLRIDDSYPVVIVQGGQDELVPPGTAATWQKFFRGPVRTIMVPSGTHDLFRGPNSDLAADAVGRTIGDFLRTPTREDLFVMEKTRTAEPEVSVFITRSPCSVPHLAASPSARAVADLLPLLSPRVPTEPTIANIEITTRCNLKCAYCARTLRGVPSGDMSKDLFRTVLGLLPHAYRITLVGLGETLLHPNVVEIVAHASSEGRRVALVTNGMLLDEGMSRELLKAGLESIAFSIDGATQDVASKIRPGTDLGRVTDNIRRFVELSRSVRPISTAVFSAVSSATVSTLTQLVELVSRLGVHVLMLTDLNFRENLGQTLWKNDSPETAGQVRTAVATAFKKNLPVLSVHGLEEFGLWRRYEKFLLLPPDKLAQRSERRSWCCSPWQTIPVNVRGEVTFCDCQPNVSVGSLLKKPLPEIWNGDVFARLRERMLGNDPPEACRICPRF